MSKLAKIPVNIKEGVNVVFENDSIKISGPKGHLSFRIPKEVDVKAAGGRLTISSKKKNNEGLKPFMGLTRAMIANMVTGVSTGFEKKLELSGVGYRAQGTGRDISISVGFSHPVNITADEGLNFEVKDNIITVSGMDKDLVGNMAARIRAIRPPEPYKGKGIRYVQERVRRKIGKTAKALGAK
ncbi:MAG: 50S ribosomal protein L6 [Candidatus Levybacteria bacterium RIFCSPHIGHO2_02_FULL_37_10]|nr:MAG: 50S ribosomal protein L6 [Candidatus Levybacteria bacterium RIFCSPHIGHO2_02_FULL_37_10]